MYNCEFIQFGEANYASIGIWFYGVNGECTEEEFALEEEGWFTGSWISTSRSCLIISMIAGAGAVALVMFEWLCCEVCCAGVLEGLAYAAAWILGLYVHENGVCKEESIVDCRSHRFGLFIISYLLQNGIWNVWH